MSDARWYAVWPEPRSRSRSLEGSRPSVPHGTNFLLFAQVLGCLSTLYVVNLLTFHFFCTKEECKNRPTPFPGQMSYKVTKPGLV